MTVVTDPWVRCWRPRPQAERRLVCFPPAGGSVGFYRSWPTETPADVELWAVQYPGREDRYGEPPFTELHRLADQIAEVLSADLSRPLWLFGHSMGAAVAYEVTRRLEATTAGSVQRLIVSGRVGPRHMRENRTAAYRLDDAGLMAELRSLGGIPEPVLAEPELVELLLPILRNDFELIETYWPEPDGVLDVPILALAGDDDPHAPVEHVGSWAEVTRRSFRLAVHPGGHFFLAQRLPAVMVDLYGR